MCCSLLLKLIGMHSIISDTDTDTDTDTDDQPWLHYRSFTSKHINSTIHSSTNYQCQWSHQHQDQDQHRDQHASKQVSPNYSFQNTCSMWYTAFQSCELCTSDIKHQQSPYVCFDQPRSLTSNLQMWSVLCHSISLCEGLTLCSVKLRSTSLCVKQLTDGRNAT